MSSRMPTWTFTDHRSRVETVVADWIEADGNADRGGRLAAGRRHRHWAAVAAGGGGVEMLSVTARIEGCHFN